MDAKLLIPLALAAATALVQAQSISNTTALSFGAFTAGSGGTVKVDSAGLRTKTGMVMLVNQGGSASVAQFTVSGTSNATYSITLPADGSVVLTDGGSNTMTLNLFTSNPLPGSGLLSAGGTQLVSIGATLTVGSSQVPGSYTGSFNITVNY